MRAKKHILELTYGPQIQFSARRDARRGVATDEQHRPAPTWPAGLDPFWAFNCVAFPFVVCVVLLFVAKVWGL
jgi:hypothetical protein